MRSDAARSWRTVVIAFLMTLILGGVVWQLVYRTVGMNLYSQTACLALLAVTAFIALRAEGLTLRAVGAGWENLVRAVLVLVLAHAVFLALVLGLRSLGLMDGPLIQVPRWRPMLLSWAAVGISEELFFRGFLLVSLGRLLDQGRFPWRAIGVSAILFSLYHVPLEVWFGVTGSELLFQLVMPVVTSVLVLGPLYILSRNLWMVILLHGLIDYPILPAIKANPLLGLVFMAVVMFLGRFVFRPTASLPLSGHDLLAA